MTIRKLSKSGLVSKIGFSIVELIFYVSILSLLLVMVVNIMIFMSASYRQIKSSSEIQNSAMLAMDRMTREIRNAGNVNLVDSVFNSNPGVLSLNSADKDDNPLAIKFYVSDGVIKIKENNTDMGPLTSSSTPVTNLIFRQLSNGKSSAIRIEMTLQSASQNFIRTENFYNTTIIGGSY